MYTDLPPPVIYTNSSRKPISKRVSLHPFKCGQILNAYFLIMKTLMKTAAMLAAIVLAGLFACQKKNTSPLSGSPETAYAEANQRSTTTGGTTSTGTVVTLAKILASSSSDDYPSAIRKVFSMDPGTYVQGSAFVSTSTSGDRYYSVGAYNTETCIVRKEDSNPDVYLYYNLTSTPDLLTLGSPAGAAFLPDEVEMLGASTSSVYALKGNTIYRIDGINTGSAYAVSVYSFPSTWLYYRKTICPSHTANAFKVIVAETGSARGSSVSQLKAYTLNNVPGTPALSVLETTVGIAYNNNQNLNSFSNETGGFTSDWYHVVIGDVSLNHSEIHRLTGTTTLSGGFTTLSSAFSADVNDCAFRSL